MTTTLSEVNGIGAKQHVSSRGDSLVAHLQKLVTSEQKGPLAELRREAYAWPECGPNALRIIAPFFSGATTIEQDSLLLIAVLFALHPKSTDILYFNMGNVMRQTGLNNGQGNSIDEKLKSTEARFMRLLGATEHQEIATHLRYAVQIAKSADVPINWTQLYRDVRTLLSEDETKRNNVMRQWSRSFWSPEKPDKSNAEITP